ncbi:MAG TPA: hypothetical protein VFA11_13395 [Acidimicrobiales bacterium]|nr:hypothetical protein [Acidimicrobiales bacterium]
MDDRLEPLPDGEYEILVIDAEDGPEGLVRISVVIVSGEMKGRVTSIKGPSGDRDGVSLMGLPGALSVRDGRPSLRLE